MSQRLKVLSLLRHAGDTGVTNAVFLDWRIPRFSARIRELREEGFEIRTEGQNNSRVRYTLVSEPDVERAGSSPDLPPGARRSLAPAASSLGAGVEHPIDIPSSHPCRGGPGRSGAPVDGVLSSERLFDMEPERTHHYEEAA